MAIVRLREHSFINALTRQSTVLDCGANWGDFSEEVTNRYGCRCWALEPNPEAACHIPQNDKITVLPLALSNSTGTAVFYVDDNIEASSLYHSPGVAQRSRDITVETVQLGDLIDRLQLSHVDLAKFDIEGAEIAVFNSAPPEVLRRVTQFTVEFHDFLPSNKPGEILATLDRLRSIGFDVICFTGHGHGDLLAFNRQKLGLSATRVAWLRHVTRNWRGVRQVLAGSSRDWHRPLDPTCYVTPASSSSR